MQYTVQDNWNGNFPIITALITVLFNIQPL